MHNIKKIVSSAILIFGVSCSTPERVDYDAGLYPTEAYENAAFLPYYDSKGPWATDPQYDYYQNYESAADRFIWEEQGLFGNFEPTF